MKSLGTSWKVEDRFLWMAPGQMPCHRLAIAACMILYFLFQFNLWLLLVDCCVLIMYLENLWNKHLSWFYILGYTGIPYLYVCMFEWWYSHGNLSLWEPWLKTKFVHLWPMNSPKGFTYHGGWWWLCCILQNWISAHEVLSNGSQRFLLIQGAGILLPLCAAVALRTLTTSMGSGGSHACWAGWRAWPWVL